jgi:membrane protein YdbS with pleckstrin-like domain
MNRIYCSNCGHMIPGNSNFCRFCGAAQHGPESAVYHADGPQLPVHAQVDPSSYNDADAQQALAAKVIEKRHLAGRAKISFFIGYIGKTSLLPLIIIIGLFLQPMFFGVLAVGYLLVVYAVTILVFNHFYFSVSNTHFSKEYGIFHKKHVTIPFEHIQNVNIRRSLLDQILGLARVDVESAGSSAVKPKEIIGGSNSLAEGHLPGLTLKDAKEVHDLMLQKAAVSQ